MKTTNYELSKKLFGIGFKAETDKLWVETSFGRSVPRSIQLLTSDQFYYSIECYRIDYEPHLKPKKLCRAYDLETILEALPGFLDGNEGGEFNHCSLELSIGYGQISYSGILNGGLNIIINKTRDESLADTAARLLILLHEKDLIEFGSENENL